MIETDCDSHSGETRLLETKPHPHLQEVTGESLKASRPIRLAGCKGALWLLGGRRGWDFSVGPPLLYVCYACSLFLAGHSEKNGVSSSSGMFSSLVVSIFPTGIFPNSACSEQWAPKAPQTGGLTLCPSGLILQVLSW